MSIHQRKACLKLIMDYCHDNKEIIKSFLGHMVGIIGICIIFYLAINIRQNLKNEGKMERNIEIIQSDYPDYDLIKPAQLNIKSTLTVFNIGKSYDENSVTNDIKTKGGVGLKNNNYTKYHIKGKFAIAYLYIGASIQNRPLSAFDDVYFEIKKENSNVLHEGHLNTSSALPAPSFADRIILLYKLDDVSFKNKNSVDFLALINDLDDKNIIIRSWVNSRRTDRKLNEVAIYYECAESTPNCSIAETK
jgi:hypothetical protein